MRTWFWWATLLLHSSLRFILNLFYINRKDLPTFVSLAYVVKRINLTVLLLSLVADCWTSCWLFVPTPNIATKCSPAVTLSPILPTGVVGQLYPAPTPKRDANFGQLELFNRSIVVNAVSSLELPERHLQPLLPLEEVLLFDQSLQNQLLDSDLCLVSGWHFMFRPVRSSYICLYCFGMEL